SLGDSVLQFKNTVPILNWNHLRMLPFVYVITQLIYGYISQSTNPQAQSGNAQQQQQMKMMMYGMPVLFFFMFYNAPSGLLIYWTVSNVIQMIQQVIINRMIAQKKAEMLNKPSNSQIRGGKKNR
ncbi:MAG: YidC/Oxa1 family membrane protein insertase, partial [Spirochaetaceae bacterium]|nr:YidC/Oxa1 family membrane protein insertase [Spirochaetaceae bacterium]